MSASKLARLKVIREKLIAPYRVEFEAGRINETLAYELAQASAEDVVDVPSAAEAVTAPLAAAEAEGDAPVVEAAAEEVEAKRAVKKAAKKASTKKNIPA